jgi:hypothetical protein
LILSWPGICAPFVEQAVSKVSTFRDYSENLWSQAFLILRGKVRMSVKCMWELLFAVFIFVGVDYLLELLEWHSLKGLVWQFWGVGWGAAVDRNQRCLWVNIP